jgi:LemA protein
MIVAGKIHGYPMSIKGHLLLLAFIVVAVYVVVIYNNLVQLKNNVAKAWSNIDVLLMQRHDELPNLVETCRQYMLHEQQTLLKVTQARAAVSDARERASIDELGPAEQQLRNGLGDLFAVAEKYPNLKANRTFRNLQARISRLEEAIADRREFYNDCVNSLNVRIDQFPDRFIASLFRFKAGKLLHFREAKRTVPELRVLLG